MAKSIKVKDIFGTMKIEKSTKRIMKQIRNKRDFEF